jgi:hypothetical protein
MAREIDIRPPLAARLIVAAVLCAWTMIVAIAFMRTLPGPVSWVLLAACAAGVFMFVRLLQISVVTRDDVLIVRNKFRTRCFLREDIIRFRPRHPRGTSWLEFLHVETTDASVPIDVLRSWTGRADRFAGEQAALEDWRSADP